MQIMWPTRDVQNIQTAHTTQLKTKIQSLNDQKTWRDIFQRGHSDDQQVHNKRNRLTDLKNKLEVASGESKGRRGKAEKWIQKYKLLCRK